MSCYNFLSGRSSLLNPRIPNVASLPIPSFLIPEFRQYTNCVLKISKRNQKNTAGCAKTWLKTVTSDDYISAL